MAAQPNLFKFIFQISGELEISRGLRTLLAFGIPVIIGQLTSHPAQGTLIGLAALHFILADAGGSYRTRAKGLIATIIACALSLFVVTLLPEHSWLQIFFTFVWMFAVGYVSVYGNLGVMAGIVTGLFFLFALDLPSGDWFLGWQRVGLSLMAGVWAMTLCLAMWPLKPDLALRESIARCYLASARYIRNYRHNSTQQAVDSAQLKRAVQLRQTLPTARQTLTLTRRGRLGDSSVGELMVVLIQNADRLMTSVESLIEFLEVHERLPQFMTVRILIDNALQQISLAARNIAKLILNKPARVELGSLRRIFQALVQQKQLQRQAISNRIEDYPSLVATDRLIVMLEKLIKELEYTAKTAYQLKNSRLPDKPTRNVSILSEAEALAESETKSWLAPLRDNFTFESTLFRHGLRLGITTAIGLGIYLLANLPQGFWILLTILLVLQPDVGQTFERFFHRIIGTILGAIVTSILLLTIASDGLLLAISVLSISVAFCLLRFHYSIAVFFITIYASILSELGEPVGDWQISLIRIFCTIMGAGLALMAAFFFFRLREGKKLTGYLARALDSSRLYFQTVMAVYLGQAGTAGPVIAQKQQQDGLAYCNAQASLQRWLSDPQTKQSQIEPALTLISYIHRFRRSITVLMVQLEHFSGSEPHPELATFVCQVERTLVNLANALVNGNVPAPLPKLENTCHQINLHLQNLQARRLEEFAVQQECTPTLRVLRDFSVVGTQLEKMVDYLTVMHSAVSRQQSELPRELVNSS